MRRTARRAAVAAALGMPLAFGGAQRAPEDAFLSVPGEPATVAAADLDGDARPDLVVSADGADARVFVLRNAGEGRFDAAIPLADLPAAPRGALRRLVATDVDRDGDLDLIGAGFPSALWRNEGGTFVCEALPEGADGDRLAVADLDGDGSPDLAVARDDVAGEIRILRNDGLGTFAAPFVVAAAVPWPPLHVASIDADGDRVADLVALSAEAGPPAVLRGLGGGTFAAPEPIALDAAAVVAFGTTGRAAVADFDGDRRSDLAAAVRRPRAGVSVLFACDGPAETPEADATTPAGELTLLRGRITDRVGVGADRLAIAGEIPEAALGSVAGPVRVEVRAADAVVVADGNAPVAERRGVRLSLDASRRRFFLTGAGLDLGGAAANPVTVTFATSTGRWRHAAAWRNRRPGELSWELPRARAETPDRDAQSDGRFETTTRRIGGVDVEVVVDRTTGRAWRFDPVLGRWVPLAADLATEPASLRKGLAAFLALDEDLADAAGGPPAVSRGGVVVADGEARFDGTGWIELPHLPLAGRAHAFSLWVRPEGAADVMGLLEQRDANSRRRHYHLMLRGGLRPYLGFYVDDLAARDAIGRGAWRHLVFQYTGTQMEIWVDGARVASRAAAAYEGTSGTTRLGRNPGWTNVGGTHFVGAMRRFRHYGRSLDPGEIAELSRRERPKAAPEGTTLVFDGSIDGSDRIVITDAEARWENVHWGCVTCDVRLNGVPWRPHGRPVLENRGETRFLPPGVDLSRARMVERSGRDFATIEHEPGRLILRFVDSPNGPAPYRIVVRFD